MSQIWVIEYKEPDETEWTPGSLIERTKEHADSWIERTKVRQATVEGDVTEYRVSLYRRAAPVGGTE